MCWHLVELWHTDIVSWRIVNIDKANSRRYDVTQYIGGRPNIRNTHISVVYIFCEVKFKFT